MCNEVHHAKVVSRVNVSFYLACMFLLNFLNALVFYLLVIKIPPCDLRTKLPIDLNENVLHVLSMQALGQVSRLVYIDVLAVFVLCELCLTSELFGLMAECRDSARASH